MNRTYVKKMGIRFSKTQCEKKRTAIFLAGLALIVVFIPVAVLKASFENKEPPVLVIRVDDIQDYAFREAQIFLLNESMINRVPVSLAVIPGAFGEDREMVQTVKLAVSLGSEVTAHGLMHEDLSTFSFEEQAALLSRAMTRIEEVLGCNARVLVPPMFNFNEATIYAMQETGYDIISSFSNLSEPGLFSKVRSIPGTVNLSDCSNNETWEMKSVDSVKAEISGSIQKYGFAVLVTHPQEFLENGELNLVNTELYRALLYTLKENYSFKTLERLGELIMEGQ